MASLLQRTVHVLEARTHIFTPAHGSVMLRPNVHSHASMYAFMHVDIYIYTHTQNRQGMWRNTIRHARL